MRARMYVRDFRRPLPPRLPLVTVQCYSLSSPRIPTPDEFTALLCPALRRGRRPYRGSLLLALGWVQLARESRRQEYACKTL